MSKLSAQMIGRLGELAVEQELLKRGWMAGNFNASLANAAAFDLFAVKDHFRVCIRVKATSGTMVQYTAKSDGSIFRGLADVNGHDFVVIVLVEGDRAAEFYVLPTRLVSEKLIAVNTQWHKAAKKDGTPRKKTPHRALDFNGPLEPQTSGRGMRLKWADYKDAWHLLERE
jgi:hypothetical protein